MIANRLRFGTFNALYAGILIPSALWMPLTFAMLERPGSALWGAIRLVLAVVGLASAAMIGALLALCPRQPAWAYGLAVAGSVVFGFHTVVLDALIWPALFPV
jgi:hypothetical protein